MHSRATSDIRTKSRGGQVIIRRSREQSVDVDEVKRKSRRIQQQHSHATPPPKHPSVIFNGTHDRSRSTESRNNNAYNINYHQEILDHINEGDAATPAQIFPDPVDSSNPCICICDMP